ncbi:hypothetical protein AX15_007446 [Amanita polypyramis BW_CC]|nr:hypothetical protein AX15_007446 [Amanita polypyramis BW_CC]
MVIEMKLNLLTIALLSLLLASLSLTVPVMGYESVGAAYTMMNQPTGNFLIVLSIGKDGTLSYINAISTGGMGQQGLTVPSGDSTFGQGGLQTASSTLTLWSVEPNNPLNITKIGSPASSGGDYPNSVIFNKAGDRLCASDAGTHNGLMYVLGRLIKIILIVSGHTVSNCPSNGSDEYCESNSVLARRDKNLSYAQGDVDLNRGDTVAISQANTRILTQDIGSRPFGWTYVNGRDAIITAFQKSPIFSLYAMNKRL